MAGNTIAKLAAVITTDDAPFQAGMNRAGKSVEKFGLRVAAQSAGLGKLGKTLSSGLSLGAGGAFIAIGAGALAATKKLTAMADKFNDVTVMAKRDYVSAFERVNGVKPDFKISELQTAAEAWQKLGDRIGGTASVAGMGSRSIANDLEGMIQFFTPMSIQEKLGDAKYKQWYYGSRAKLLNEQADARDKNVQKEIDDIQKDFDRA